MLLSIVTAVKEPEVQSRLRQLLKKPDTIVEAVSSKENRRANTFDFLGFTHYCGKNRKGKFILSRKTSKKKFRMKCKEMIRPGSLSELRISP